MSFYSAPNGITLKWPIVSVLIHPKEMKRGHWAHEVYMDSPAGPYGPWTLTGMLPSLTHTRPAFSLFDNPFTLWWPRRPGRWNLCQRKLCWSLTWLLSGTRMNFPLSLKRRTQAIMTAWNDTEVSSEYLYVLWFCHSWEQKHKKAPLSLRIHSGTDGKPISTKLKNCICRRQPNAS